jgi:hypothetical protein
MIENKEAPVRDPNRIPKILRALQTAWQANPDLRLGQLITNVLGNKTFHTEDDETENLLYQAARGTFNTNYQSGGRSKPNKLAVQIADKADRLGCIRNQEHYDECCALIDAEIAHLESVNTDLLAALDLIAALIAPHEEDAGEHKPITVDFDPETRAKIRAAILKSQLTSP